MVRYFRIVRNRKAHDPRSSILSCGTTPITTAIFLALASMFLFGAGFVLTQFGLRWMRPWLGVAISIPTSTLLFWCLAPFFVPLFSCRVGANSGHWRACHQSFLPCLTVPLLADELE